MDEVGVGCCLRLGNAAVRCARVRYVHDGEDDGQQGQHRDRDGLKGSGACADESAAPCMCLVEAAPGCGGNQRTKGVVVKRIESGRARCGGCKVERRTRRAGEERHLLVQDVRWALEGAAFESEGVGEHGGVGHHHSRPVVRRLDYLRTQCSAFKCVL